MKHTLLSSTLLAALFSIAASASARDADLLDLSLDELLDVRVDTVTVGTTTWRHQPATVTLLTADELKSLGARNLMEALEFVPGTSFGVDVFGVISLNFRGHWAHEGKVLLLLDDLPINDLMYGNLNLARHYPVEQIDRIEVLRGAGAAKYGGNAQLAVIRVYSRKLEGHRFEAHLTADHVKDAGMGGGATFTVGMPLEEGEFMLSGHLYRGEWSGQDWLDGGGAVSRLDRLAGLSAGNVIARLDWRNLHLRGFFDRHDSETPHFFGKARDGEAVSFSSVNLSASYDWRLSDTLSLHPRYRHRSQKDWFIDRDPAIIPPPAPGDTGPRDFFIPVSKDTVNLDLRYVMGGWAFQGGLEYWWEQAECDSPGGLTPTCATFFQGEADVEYNGKAAFAQGDWQQGPWSVSLGLRYSDHSYAGDSLVPRASLVYAWDDWQLKLHYGQAYREPDVIVINDATAGQVESEITTQKEIEVGWRPTKSWFGTLSLFSMEMDNPLIYATSDTSYTNYDPVETQGIETEWRWRSGSKQAHLTYSWYRSASEPNAKYAVAGHDDLNIGVPRHKATAAFDYGLPGTGWNLQGSLVWYGDTYANVYDGAGLSVQSLPDQTFLNVQARYQRKDWEASIGIYDLTNEGRLYPQPYLDASTPYPGSGRQLWGRLALRWP